MAAIVFWKYGRETPRVWYVVAWVLAGLGPLLAGEAPAASEQVAVAQSLATTNLICNPISAIWMTAISRRTRRRTPTLVNRMEAPQLWGDVLVSGIVLAAVPFTSGAAWVDAAATLVLAAYVLLLAWVAKREAESKGREAVITTEGIEVR